MQNEMMNLEQLADYLRRDSRELTKLASRGHLPGQKVAGQWRFARAEINHWLETQLPGYTDEQLTDLETHYATDLEPLLTTLLTPATTSVPLPATTRPSVLRELVRVAEQSWHIFDPEAMHEAIVQREQVGSTALPSGVAIPHPRRPMPNILGESVIALGRTASPVPFGMDRGGMTDVFFLVCCRDDRTHLRSLARLSRLLLRPGFLDQLRDADNAADTWQLIRDAELELVE